MSLGVGPGINPNCHYGDHDWEDGECLACGERQTINDDFAPDVGRAGGVAGVYPPGLDELEALRSVIRRLCVRALVDSPLGAVVDVTEARWFNPTPAELAAVQRALEDTDREGDS